jgi:hypothetical protein
MGKISEFGPGRGIHQRGTIYSRYNSVVAMLTLQEEHYLCGIDKITLAVTPFCERQNQKTFFQVTSSYSPALVSYMQACMLACF